MPRVTFDSSVFISYKPTSLPSGSLLSVVVIQELLSGARDNSEVREWIATANKFNKEGRLLVPTMEDWLQTGRVINLLLRGLTSTAKGKTPKLPYADKQRIIRDVLIARTVKRAGALLVTDNLRDFKIISRYCNVRIMSGKDFFSR